MVSQGRIRGAVTPEDSFTANGTNRTSSRLVDLRGRPPIHTGKQAQLRHQNPCPRVPATRPCLGNDLAPIPVAPQRLVKGRLQCRGISEGDDGAHEFMAYDLGVSPDVRGNHRESAGHSLKDDVGPTLAPDY